MRRPVLLLLLFLPFLIYARSAMPEEEPFSYGPNDTYDQSVVTPKAVLGYNVGEQFTPHHMLVEFLKQLSASSNRVRLHQYGDTYEGRPLYLLVISSPENPESLETIRGRLKKLSDPRLLASGEADDIIASSPAVAWLSYNVHGNEACGTEAAIQVAYQLAAGTDEKTRLLLKDLIIIIDPVLNPDGRERYVSFFQRTVGNEPNTNIDAVEHHEPWPGGRSNHYYFDLNRDWAWLTQRETRQRIAAYREWLPQVHADFHEMGYNSSYFFFPSRHPINRNIPRQVVKWAKIYGEGNAKAFDRHGWQYFTGEGFDLFYPGFGDSWPSFNGAVGMTYEQGGSGTAGLALRRDDGVLLTLTDRAWHHFVTSMATLETTQRNRKERLQDYWKSWQEGFELGRKSDVKYYILPSQVDINRQADFIDLLIRQGIEVWKTSESFHGTKLEGYSGGIPSREFPAGTFLVPVAQPAYRFLTALFEPDPALSDTFFYDVTAWCLPVVYGIDTYWTRNEITCKKEQILERPAIEGEIIGGEASYAYLLPWNDDRAATALFKLLKHKWRVGVSTKPFRQEDRTFDRGTIVIPVKNRIPASPDSSVHKVVSGLAAEYGLVFHSVNTGLTEKGIDLGSDRIRRLKIPRIGMVTGTPVSSTSFGSLWFMLDQHFNIDFSALTLDQLKRADLRRYDVLVFPRDHGRGSGYKSELDSVQTERIKRWIEDGGTYVGIQGGAVFATASSGKICSVKLKKQEKSSDKKDEKRDDEKEKKRRQTLEEREKEAPVRYVPGAILRMHLDNTHPLGYGYGREVMGLKLGGTAFELSEEGYNVGIYTDEPKFAGFISEENQKKIAGSAFLIQENLGRGNVILFAEDPNFRFFWRGLTRLFLNAILLGQIM